LQYAIAKLMIAADLAGRKAWRTPAYQKGGHFFVGRRSARISPELQVAAFEFADFPFAEAG
jgi:hypothetical protein